jgi:hypothetical protein
MLGTLHQTKLSALHPWILCPVCPAQPCSFASSHRVCWDAMEVHVQQHRATSDARMAMRERCAAAQNACGSQAWGGGGVGMEIPWHLANAQHSYVLCDGSGSELEQTETHGTGFHGSAPHPHGPVSLNIGNAGPGLLWCLLQRWLSYNAGTAHLSTWTACTTPSVPTPLRWSGNFMPRCCRYPGCVYRYCPGFVCFVMFLPHVSIGLLQKWLPRVLFHALLCYV